MLPHPVPVAEVRRETDDVVTLELDICGQDGAAPAPGQFAMLYAFGIGEAAISVSGFDEAEGRVAHTIRAVGPVTQALAGTKPGHRIGLRGPYGSAWPLAELRGRDILIVAGGIGFAPLRGAVAALLADRASFGRVMLAYGTRTPADIVFAADLAAWGAEGDMELDVTVDHAGPGWRGKVGVVTGLIPRMAPDPGRTVALICGPEVMMRATVAALEGLGFRRESLYLSLERNMKCAVAHCGRCQYGPAFICREGPVFRFDRIAALMRVREL